MHGKWYVVALFYLLGYLPFVIGFLIVILITLHFKVLKNRLLFTLSFFFYFLAIFLSPQLLEDRFEHDYVGLIKITSNIEQRGNNLQFTGKLLNDKSKALFYVQLDGLDIPLNHGATCLVNAKLSTPDPATNEGQFDYRRFLATQGIHYISFNPTIEYCSGRSALSYFFQLRHTLISYASKNLLDETDAWISAIIFGDRSKLDAKIVEQFQYWNISHLLAISGLHVGLTIGLFYLMFQHGFKLTKNTTKQLLLLIIPIYMIIAGLNPPVMRAGLMAFLLIIIQQFRSKLDQTDLLSIVFLVLLINEPHLVFQLSFQFSFVVTLSLLLSKKLILNQPWLISSVRVSLISQLILLPLQFEYFYFTNIFSFLLNLVYVPYFTFFVIPITVIMLVLSWIKPVQSILQILFLNIHELFINLIIWIDQPKMAIWVHGKPEWITMIVYYVLLFLFMKYWEKGKIKKAAVLICLAIFTFIIESMLPYFDSTYSITMLDVGQSESIVVELPYRKGIFLIDAGEEVNNQQEFHNFNHVIKPYLWSKGITKVDAFFVSHFDYDHSGAFDKIAQEFNPDYIFVHPFSRSDVKLYENRVFPINEGVILHFGGAKIEVLSPSRNDAYDNENDRSLVLLFEVNDVKALYTGDITSNVEKVLREIDQLHEIDLLKVAHHGSNTSTTAQFLQQVKPKIALISVGRNNWYGHPSITVLERLEEVGSKVLRTDQHGAIFYKYKDGQSTVSTYLP